MQCCVQVRVIGDSAVLASVLYSGGSTQRLDALKEHLAAGRHVLVLTLKVGVEEVG